MHTQQKMGFVVASVTLILTVMTFAPYLLPVTVISDGNTQSEIIVDTATEPAPPGMIAYWELNENSGSNIYDSVGPYVNGFTTGGPTWITGIAESGLELLTNQFIDFGYPTDLYTTQYLTIEAWVNLPDTSGLHTILINSYNSVYTMYNFAIQDGHLYFDRQSGAPGNYFTSSASITAGEWHHVAVVMNNGPNTISFYIDGEEQIIYGYNDYFYGPTGQVTIGADRSGGAPSFLLGMIDEVAVYNSIVSRPTIVEHYEKGLLGLGYLDDFPTNEAPVAQDDSYTMDQDTTLIISAPGVLENDIDNDGDSLETDLISTTLNGGLVLNPDGSFVYTPVSEFVGIDTFEYRAYDEVEYSTTATCTITVEAVNHPPVAVDDTYTTDEEVLLSIASPGILANDYDPEPWNYITAELVTGPQHGSLTLSLEGNFEYSPDFDWFGTDSFTYRVFDGTVYGNIATVTITVNPVNDAPVAGDDEYTGDEDNELSETTMFLNDFDVDGDSLEFILVSVPSHGALVIDIVTGFFTFQPDADWSGIDIFTYQLYDGSVYSNVATVTLTITAVNDVPVAGDDAYSGLEDLEMVHNVLDNDLDLDGDSLEPILVSGPTHGTLDIYPDGSFTYLPNLNWFGVDSFTYQVYDGQEYSNVATVTLTIDGVNDAPIITRELQDQVALEDEWFNYWVLSGTFIDIDPGDYLTYSAITPDWMSYDPTDPPRFYGVPGNDDVGIFVVEIIVTDSYGASISATFRVIVENVNDAPYLMIPIPDQFATEDSLFTYQVPSGTFQEFDIGDSMTYSAITPDWLSFDSVTQTFSGIPENDHVGIHLVEVFAVDGYGAYVTDSFEITVINVNDPPFATDDAYFGLEDLPIVETTLLDNDFDLEGNPLELVLVSGPSHGTLDIYPDGSFTYLPDLNWFGVDSFTYQAFDGLEYSNVATVTITIESVNDSPVVIEDDFLGLEDSLLWGDVLANDYDVEWDVCIVFLVETPLHGTVDIHSGSGVFSYLPDPDWFGIDSFTYNVYDGHVLSDVVIVILNIQPVNDAPVAYSIAFVGNEDVVLYETLPLGFDVDGDALQYIVDTGPAHGTLILDSNTGAFSFTPDTDWFGSDSFTYQVFDGELYSGVATVEIFILEDDDTTGPEITIIYTGDATDSSPGYWDITVFDPESGVASISVEIDGILVGTFEGTYLVSNALGDHQIVVTAINADSNNGANDQESSTSSNTVTIVDDDVTGPVIDITYFGDMTEVNPGFWTVSVNDPESGVYSILVEVDGVAVGTSEGDYGVPGSLGFHSITVTAINGDTDIPSDQETSTRSAAVPIEGTTLPTELIYTGDLEGIYSDPAYLEALLIDTTTGMPIPGKIIHFSLGPHSVTGLTDMDGLASIILILDQESGIYALVVSFDGDDEYLPSSSTNEFLLNKECASLVYSGLTIIEVSEESMTLMATVFDDVDDYWGDLSLAYVTFTVYLSSDPLTPIYITSPVKVQTTDVVGIGLATAEIPNLPEGDYLVIASLLPGHNRFYCGPDTEAVMVTIYEPERAHAHGAGMIIDADGHRGFYVFKAKYYCEGTLKGFLLYIYIVGDWVYLVRSYDITGFVTDGNHGFFEANGTVSRYNFETHEKVCSDERYRIRVDVIDNWKNHEKDVFQIQVFDNLGLVEYEAGFDPFGYILRGCIVVKHGRRH